MIDVQDIYTLYTQRLKRLTPMHARLIQVREIVNGDAVLPLPELDAADRPAVANLLLQDVEQKGSRIASTMPSVKFPPKRFGIQKSMDLARDRGLVMDYWYDQNTMSMKMQQRARHAVGYAMSPTMVRPHAKTQCPWWQVRDPITTYLPELEAGEISPPDIVFSYLKSGAWVRQTYPQQYALLNKSKGDKPIRILEYCDDKELVLVAVGESNQMPTLAPLIGETQAGKLVELERLENRIGRCWATVPGRLGLDRIQGDLEGVVGMYQQLAKIMALETIGVQRDIWPETWAVGRPGEKAHIIHVADPLRGVTGEIEGGEIVFQQRPASQAGLNLMDRLERGIRVEASIPADFGGESATNIRTGRRGNAVMSAAIDFPLQAIHQMFEAALVEENKIAIAIDKAYFPTAKTFPTPTKGWVTYTPEKLWETDVNFVQYAQAGVDAEALTINLGQMAGAELISKRSAMEMHPLIDDPEMESDRIQFEQLNGALLQAVQTQAAQDPTFAPYLAEMMNAVLTDKLSLDQAYLKVHRELQQQQAEQAQQQPVPGGLPSPDGQPGLGMPAQIPPPSPSAQNLSQLLRTIRPRNQSPAPAL